MLDKETDQWDKVDQHREELMAEAQRILRHLPNSSNEASYFLSEHYLKDPADECSIKQNELPNIRPRISLEDFHRYLQSLGHSIKIIAPPDSASLDSGYSPIDPISMSDPRPGPLATDEMPASAYLFKQTDIKTFGLNSVSGWVFEEKSLWVCGWTKRVFGAVNIVVLELDYDNRKVVSTFQKKFPGAHLPLILFKRRDYLYFAKRGDNTLYRLNTRLQTLDDAYMDGINSTAAMCGNENYLYILDKSRRKHIQVFNKNFNKEFEIETGLTQVDECDTDMCLQNLDVEHAILVSTTCPASVRCLSHQGMIWQLDCRSCPQLDLEFTPVSVTSSRTMGIFIADRGSQRVSAFC